MARHKKMILISILTVLCMIPTSGSANDDNGRKGQRQGPPPEAIKACEGKDAGSSVEFTGRRGETLQAVCQEINGQLAAVPEGMKHNRSND